MNPFMLDEAQIIFGGLVLLRVSAFLFSAAVLSTGQISVQVKVLLSIVLSLVIYFPMRNTAQINLDPIQSDLILIAAKELIVGLAIGTLTRFFFFCMSMAGDLISVSVGLNSAQLYNPMLGMQTSSLEQFQTLVATLVFFALQGHHLLVSSLFQSFEHVQVLSLDFKTKSFLDVAMLGSQLMEVSIKIAAPILLSILATNVTLGILGRAVPQLNVLMTSFAITISVGLVVLILTLPLMISEMNSIINLTGSFVFKFMREI